MSPWRADCATQNPLGARIAGNTAAPSLVWHDATPDHGPLEAMRMRACAVHMKVESAGSRPRQQRSRSWTQMLERLHRRRLTSNVYEHYENTNVLETERGGRGAPKMRPKTDAESGPLLVGEDHSCRAQPVSHSCLDARRSLQFVDSSY